MLDEQKGDPRPHRSKLQDRARKVLGVLYAIMDSQDTWQPVDLPANVEILVLDREPCVFPPGSIRSSTTIASLHPQLNFAGCTLGCGSPSYQMTAGPG